MRRLVKWNIGRISIFDFAIRMALSTCHRLWYAEWTSSAGMSVLVRYPFSPSHLSSASSFVVIADHLNVSIHLQELVITSLVYVAFRKRTTSVCFFRQYIPFTCCGHLVRSVVRISHQQLTSVTFVILDHPPVDLRLPKYPFLYLPTLVPDFYNNNIFVSFA